MNVYGQKKKTKVYQTKTAEELARWHDYRETAVPRTREKRDIGGAPEQPIFNALIRLRSYTVFRAEIHPEST